MLGTIVLDAYKENEKIEIADALKAIANARNTSSPWASAGIYCFWDYYTNEIYYFGLAIDLYKRFKQHNGLSKTSEKNCKKKEIDEYFKKKDKLGFSIMLQSSLSQPITSSNKSKFKKSLMNNQEYVNDISQYAKSHISTLEGVNIETFNKKFGYLPKWNKIRGSFYGTINSSLDDYELTELFTPIKPNFNVSRATLRELHNNRDYYLYESHLHSIRICNTSIDNAIKLQQQMGMGIIWDEILLKNYLNKPIII